MHEMADESLPGDARVPAAGEQPASGAPRTLSRRAMLRALAAGGGTALLAACQQAPAAPPRPAAGGAPAAPASSAAAGPAAWEQQWEALIAAARQEGRLVFGAPPCAAWRRALPAKFGGRFGVEMESLASPPNQGEFIERLVRER